MGKLTAGFILLITRAVIWFNSYPIASGLRRISNRYAAFYIHGLLAAICGVIGLVFIGQFLW